MKIRDDAARVVARLKTHYDTGFIIFTAGNGGSASIANHMAVDWMKVTNGRLRVVSLASNPGMLTMIANDFHFDDVFSKQLEWFRCPENRTVVLISSSGASANVIKAAIEAKKTGATVIAFVGNARRTGGGTLGFMSDIKVYCDSEDYGEIEDYHSQVMHEVVRQLRGES